MQRIQEGDERAEAVEKIDLQVRSGEIRKDEFWVRLMRGGWRKEGCRDIRCLQRQVSR